MFRRRLSRRLLLLLTIGAVLVVLLHQRLSLTGAADHADDSESARLARHMNSNPPAVTSRSSRTGNTGNTVNWTALPLRHPPPPPLRRLPLSRPVPLPSVQQHPSLFPRSDQKQLETRREQVKAAFARAWAAYRAHAWRRDALNPLSGTPRQDAFTGSAGAGGEVEGEGEGWMTTLVDSLDTLWIMGMRAEFDEAVAAVAEGLDFWAGGGGSADDGDGDDGNGSGARRRLPTINMFEVNIRLLGGLLGAYDLSGRAVLLEKAVALGEVLYRGFDTPNRMPVDFLDMNVPLDTNGPGLAPEPAVVSASPGTLALELTRLAQLTGDDKYFDAVERVMELFDRGQMDTRIPGLWPVYVSMARADVVDGDTFGIAGGADSLYEYLPKMYALLGGAEPRYERMTHAWMDAANRTLLFRPMLPGGEDVLMVGAARALPDSGGGVEDDDGKEPRYRVELDPESEHLGCFVGGAYALAGRLLRRPDWVDDLGAKLTAGCVYAYRAMPTGIMPERYNTVPCPSRAAAGSGSESCPWDEAAFDRERRRRPEWAPHLPRGFTTAKDPRYLLRPEAIESVFVMYRVTGRREYQDAAWDMFLAISNATATPYANAAVRDVTRAEYPLPQEDYMESFWLAETLKYFYLIFSPPDLISLDEYVFNTEAHPFRRPQRARNFRPS